MSNNTKAAITFSAIALLTIGMNVMNYPAKAQSTTADSFNFDEITAEGEGRWNFSSENETVSIEDNLNQLREYDISSSENYDIRVIRENRRDLGIRRWGNKGDRSYYLVDDNFYPYYLKNRYYNYY